LGDSAASDTITATGRFASDLVPSTDSARDLGTAALQWADAHIDAGYIDAITTATVSGSSTLQMVGATTLVGALNVTGAVTAASTITAAGLLSSSAGAQFVGNSIFGGTLAVSGNVTLGDAMGDSLTVNAGAVSYAQIANTTFTPADDGMYFYDDGDGTFKRQEWNVIAGQIAGTGITDTNGVLSVDQSGGDRVTVTAFGDEDKVMTVGINYATANLGQDRTATLPAAPDVGDIVIIKVSGLAGFKLTVSRNGTQTIDGATSVDLESNGGAISVCYVANNLWKIY
jgi:hypothetical protein